MGVVLSDAIALLTKHDGASDIGPLDTATQAQGEAAPAPAAQEAGTRDAAGSGNATISIASGPVSKDENCKNIIWADGRTVLNQSVGRELPWDARTVPDRVRKLR